MPSTPAPKVPLRAPGGCMLHVPAFPGASHVALARPAHQKAKSAWTIFSMEKRKELKVEHPVGMP